MEVTRRRFVKEAAVLGAGAVIGEGLFGDLVKGQLGQVFAASDRPDIVSVKGKEYFANTFRAIEDLGGIGAFVRKGDRVGLLVNSPFKNPGSSVNPDIVLAVIKMCMDAGSREIRYLKDPHRGYWERTALAEKYASLIKDLKYESGDYVKQEIPGAVILKDASVTRDLSECDVLINMSIAKHHKGVHYSGALKNMMGLCPFSTNSYFHFGTLRLGWYGDIEHLSQCIADLNLVRQPGLCLSDATTFLTENGPTGPGNLARRDTVVASPNRVSLDAFCCQLLGLRPEEVVMIRKAFQHGMGEIYLQKLQVKTITV